MSFAVYSTCLGVFYLFACVSCLSLFFFFQAEDGIRDAQESRGLGDVYKRQIWRYSHPNHKLSYTRKPILSCMMPFLQG